MTIHSAGDCPVCPGSSYLLTFVELKGRTFIYFCPLCEVAWRELPASLDEFLEITDVAPHGIRELSEADLIRVTVPLTDLPEWEWAWGVKLALKEAVKNQQRKPDLEDE